MAAPMEVAAARFLLTSGHLVATILALSRQDADDASAAGASAMAVAGFALSLAALALGLDASSPSRSAVHVLSHFLGGVLVCRQLLLALPAASLWGVVALAHGPPALCSLSALASLRTDRRLVF